MVPLYRFRETGSHNTRVNPNIFLNEILSFIVSSFFFNRYFASEQHKTGKPVPGFLGKPPYELDQETVVIEPFDLRQWVEKNRKDIEFHQYKRMFDEEFQFQVFAYSGLKITDRCDIAETWFWVIVSFQFN